MARNDAGQQLNKVLHDAWQDGLGGNVDETDMRLAQQPNQDQESLFIVLEARKPLEHLVLEAERRDGDDGLGRLVRHRFP